MLFLKSSNFLIFIFFLIFPLNTIFAEKVMGAELLSEKGLHAIMDKMDEAVKKRDPGGIVRFMTPDILIKVIVKNKQGTEELRMTREQYRQHLGQAFQAIDDYSFSRTVLNIQIESDRSHATVITHISEKITMGEVILHTETREIAKFKVIEKKIWITSLEASTTVEQDQLFEL